ncbi:hypothetical protein O988_00011, partial [Pseudogymnoascus sp. VKM F-3808]
ADLTVAQTPRPVAIYAQQRSAGHHLMILAVDHTSTFCCKGSPRLLHLRLSVHALLRRLEDGGMHGLTVQHVVVHLWSLVLFIVVNKKQRI